MQPRLRHSIGAASRWAAALSLSTVALASGCANDRRGADDRVGLRATPGGEGAIAMGQNDRPMDHQSTVGTADGRVDRQNGSEGRDPALRGNADETTALVKDRQNVAGHAEVVTPLAAKLKDKLGDAWTLIQDGPGSFMATRRTPSQDEKGVQKSVNGRIRDQRGANDGLHVTYNGTDTVTVRGSTRDCGHAVDVANHFASIDGVNSIAVHVDCTPPTVKEMQTR